MAQKKITDLTLRSDFDETCQMAVDDTAQTWRATGAQMLAWLKEQLLQYVTAEVTTPVTPSGNAEYHTFGLSLTTPNIVGSKWLLSGHIYFFYNGSFAEYSLCGASWFAADGANIGTPPTALSPEFGATLSNGYQDWATDEIHHVFLAKATEIIVGPDETVFLVPQSISTTPSNGQMTGQIIARRIE